MPEPYSELIKLIDQNIKTNGKQSITGALLNGVLRKMGQQVNAGEKYQYGGKLWKVLQQHTVQENWKPGEGTESLYPEVSKGHAGTKDDLSRTTITWSWRTGNTIPRTG